MSGVHYRPRIRRVVLSKMPAIQTGGARVAPFQGQTLQEAIRAISPTLSTQLAEHFVASTTTVEALLSVPRAQRLQLAAERQVLAQHGSAVPLDALKVSVLAGLNAAGYVAQPAVLEAPLESLASARTEPEVEAARTTLIALAQKAHVHTLAHVVTTACAEATTAAGFRETTTHIDRLGHRRVVGLDDHDRAIVSEIRITGKAVSLNSEVVGVSDGSCTALLDALDRELTRRGVEARGSRARTGGICRLDSAKAQQRSRARRRPQVAPQHMVAARN